MANSRNAVRFTGDATMFVKSMQRASEARRIMVARLPCPHPRGSPERIECYRVRLELGIDLNQPGDSEDIIPIPHAGCAKELLRDIHRCRLPFEVEQERL